MSPIPKDLLLALASAGNDLDRAANVIEEHIMYRRGKGDTLYDVSNHLVELENKLPPRSAAAIRQAQYTTNVPPSSDLRPPSGPSNNPSSSPASVLAYLLSEPTPSVQQARDVILEYVLSREAKLRDKKPGRGGKGTLGRDGFEEIGTLLGEIEDGLRGRGPLATGRNMTAAQAPDDELPPARQLGLALVLSLRMLLSYFTLTDLGRQLLSQTPQDAVRTLVQHIRRRVPGEGRFNVGRELEYIESLTLHRRPALRPAFRSARARTHMPTRSVYPIPLPAPSKSACIKLLNAFIRDVDQAGATAATSYMAPPGQGLSSSRKKSPLIGGPSGTSPGSPVNSPGSPVRTTNLALPVDQTPIENYTHELISEWLTREKREYMAKNKWAKSGRDQLHKDLLDIETALCVSGKGAPSKHTPELLPVFLLLRRTYSLPATTLPNSVIGSAYEMLPMPPEPDGVPLAEPTVSSATAQLYVNPRLPDTAALDAIEELLESEREKGMNADVSVEKTISWLLGQVEQIQKRFPDGSYETVFEQAKVIAAHPRVWPDVSTTSAFPSHPLINGGHRRSKSSAVSPVDGEVPPLPDASPSGKFHSRSASLPPRSSEVTGMATPASSDRQSPATPTFNDSEASTRDLDSDSDDSYSEMLQGPRNGAKFRADNFSAAASKPLRQDTIKGKKVPPMLNLSTTGPVADLNDDLLEPPKSATSIATPISISSATGSSGGWWDVVSASDHNSPAPRRSPLLTDDSRSDSARIGASPDSLLGVMTGSTLPPGAQSPIPNGAALHDGNSPTTPSSLPTSRTAPPAMTPRGVDAPAFGDHELIAADMDALGLIAPRKAPPVPRANPYSATKPTLTLAEAEHAAAAAAAIAATEAKLAGNSTKSAPSSTNTTPQVTPTMPSANRSEPLATIVPRRSEDTAEALDEFGAASNPPTPKTAPATGARPWPTKLTDTGRAYGTQSRSAGGMNNRPPPVPITIHRPGFPSRAPPEPMSAREIKTDAQEASAKSKFGQFGRSVSLGARQVMGRTKPEKEVNNDKVQRKATMAQVRAAPITNNPERWNRDMVAGIMGPPVERR